MEALLADDEGTPDLEALCRAHERALVHLMVALLHDVEVARALVREVFRQFLAEWPAAAAGHSAETGLYRIAVLRMREHPNAHRPPRRRPSRSGEALLDAIAALDLREREAVALCDVDRSERSDAADILGRSERELRELLERGRAQMRRQMKGER